MQSNKSNISELFESRIQYVIPLFQRGYVWTLEEEMLPLWADIMEQVSAAGAYRSSLERVGSAGQLKPPRKHFMGTVVLGALQEGNNGRVNSREVIDGQQRITTFQLLLLAFRDLMKDLNSEVCREELAQFTRNSGSFLDKTDHHKVKPTNAGRDIMRSLVEQGGLEQVCSRYPAKTEGKRIERPALVQAYLFFYGAISMYLRGMSLEDTSDGIETSGKSYAHQLIAAIRREQAPALHMKHRPMDEERAHRLLSVLGTGLQLIVLRLDDQEDDPQIIFETLNARGVPLQPSDLVRNYLFLLATRKNLDVDALYDEYWRLYDETPDQTAATKGLKFWKVEERQGRLKSSRLDLFLYHYLRLRRGEEIKATHVFEEFKAWWESEPRDIAEELRKLKEASEHFKNFLAPNQASRIGVFCRRIRMLETTTLAPLVMYFMEHHPGASPDLSMVLSDLESYLIRRTVCGLTSKGYNQLFTRLLRRLRDMNTASPEALRRLLQELDTDSYLWPDDQDFRDRWLTRPLYIKGGLKAKAVLEGLEGAIGSEKQEWRDLPDTLSVEHVMPQKWEQNWPLPESTDEARAVRELHIHTVGNLTLLMPGFNAALSNEPFSVKRQDITTTSLLRLNTYFQRFSGGDSEWDESAIRSRGEALFEVAKRLWPHPGSAEDRRIGTGSEEGHELTPLFTRDGAVRRRAPASGLIRASTGEYYASFGEGDRRLWIDAKRFGFFSAGGGAWYSRTLKLLQPGDRLWVHIPDRGYAAVGRVEKSVVKVDQFRVRLDDGREVPLSDPSVGIQAEGMFQYQDDPEKAEYLVGIQWLKALPLSEAVWEPGFFAVQHSVCQPKAVAWHHTVSRLKEIWGIE